MTSIAFFAHDENDAAVRRRVRAFEHAGYDVAGFSMRRGERAADSWSAVDLGRTYDGRYFQRLRQIVVGARRATAARDLLADCSVVYARNLDMLLCAQWALKNAKLSKPLVYECLDIHRLMHRRDTVGVTMRWLERRLLKKTALMVVSSPAFLREYFEPRHAGAYRAKLIENRLAPASSLRPRPLSRTTGDVLRIGWFGVLRCARSLNLLESVAERFEGRVDISMYGYPDIAVPDFHERIARHENMRYHGRYCSPDDLERIYQSVDVVWAGDFHDAGFNSRWLLPNRIYEGGYFATPAIAPAECETGRWISARGAGFTIDEPLERLLPELIDNLLETPELITKRQESLLNMPVSAFAQPATEMQSVIEEAIASFKENRPSQSLITKISQHPATV